MTDSTSENPMIAAGLRTVEIEADAVAALQHRIGSEFLAACKLMIACQGRVIVTGMGKSGHIGKKIAATFASTGTPAFFVHPGEASHGDLGMITEQDVVIAISSSGGSTEVITLLPLLKRLGTPLIAMTGNLDSPLAQQSDTHLDISVSSEACPLGLAPTSSTTVTLVMGDALAVALLEARGFTAEDFAFSHPGGTLGRKLLLKVEDIMHSGDAIPRVLLSTPITDALIEMSQKGLGFTTVCDPQGALLGVLTDGDLRRGLDQKIDIYSAVSGDLMTTEPLNINSHTLAAEALNLMENRKITSLIISDNSTVIGVLHLHDILKAGVV
jgi:arabinose-5-phosphate isomerase|tara:strand:- start:623 stop:1603 length:981 start_codon:yes stop_codon:yes gene_type:complete